MTEIKLRRSDSSPNACTLTLGGVSLVFSYDTCVAFAVSGHGWVLSENRWGATTGRHIRAEVPLGVEPVPHQEFEQRLERLFGHLQAGSREDYADVFAPFVKEA